jgi:hypothetical protein
MRSVVIWPRWRVLVVEQGRYRAPEQVLVGDRVVDAGTARAHPSWAPASDSARHRSKIIAEQAPETRRSPSLHERAQMRSTPPASEVEPGMVVDSLSTYLTGPASGLCIG